MSSSNSSTFMPAAGGFWYHAADKGRSHQLLQRNSHLARGWLRGRVECELVSATDELAEAAWKSLQPN